MIDSTTNPKRGRDGKIGANISDQEIGTPFILLPALLLVFSLTLLLHH